MSAWKPISTAPKDKPIDLWSATNGICPLYKWREYFQEYFPVMHGRAENVTHWREPDKGPGQEEGEVRWMVESNGRLGDMTWLNESAAQLVASLPRHRSQCSVVRVRIVREKE